MLRLRDNLSCCICGDRVIFLDLAADRYFCLAAPLDHAMKTWLAGAATDREEGALLDRGILAKAQDAVPVPRSASVLSAKADLPAGLSVRGTDAVRAAATQVAVAIGLRLRPLREMVGACTKAASAAVLPPEPIETRARLIVACMERSAFYLGSTNRCLTRALATIKMCRRQGVPAKLVFGVRVDPFAAHAWVQFHDRVVVGDFEQVRLFTPILSVGP